MNKRSGPALWALFIAFAVLALGYYLVTRYAVHTLKGASVKDNNVGRRIGSTGVIKSTGTICVNECDTIHMQPK